MTCLCKGKGTIQVMSVVGVDDFMNDYDGWILETRLCECMATHAGLLDAGNWMTTSSFADILGPALPPVPSCPYCNEPLLRKIMRGCTVGRPGSPGVCDLYEPAIDGYVCSQVSCVAYTRSRRFCLNFQVQHKGNYRT